MAIYSGKDPLSRAIKHDARGVALQLKGLMGQIGNIVVNETKKNFKRQGFMDRSLKKWKPRKVTDEGRAILVKTGRLKRSITRLSTSAKRVTVGSKGKAAVYAGVHNHGLRAGGKKTFAGSAGTATSGGFTMPKRQFLGESHETNKRIVKLLEKKVKRGFNYKKF